MKGALSPLMFRKFLGLDADTLSAAEEVAVSRLARSHRQLIVESGRVNTKSEAGYNSCAAFLDGLDATARAMRIDSAPRSYRLAFTINYRALFPDEARNYRVDVLEASVEQYAVAWVNGDKFEFSAEALRRAEELQRSWSELGLLLERWGQATAQRRVAACPTRTDLRRTLLALDFAWASFEHKYIAELIEIEEKARRLIVNAIEHERCLQLIEAHHREGETLRHLSDYQEEQRRLVSCIARLNSVANFRRKGRDDLGVDVLADACAALARCDAAELSGQNAEFFGAARILATDVVESFAAMREYLREVEGCLDRVDPHFCNNVGLVARLVDWEESWEVGTRYVQQQKLLSAVCDLVAEIRAAQRLVPALAAMCEECDVELFLVLPRIVWLRFLRKPKAHWELLKSLLPHRFQEERDCEASEVHCVNDELDHFMAKFRRTREFLETNTGILSPLSDAACRNHEGTSAEDCSAWGLLMKRVIVGTGHDIFGGVLPAHRDEAIALVEEFMLDLERWSIELQRHCPEDWNQCSAVLVQCLSGGGQKPRQGAFRV